MLNIVDCFPETFFMMEIRWLWVNACMDGGALRGGCCLPYSYRVRQSSALTKLRGSQQFNLGVNSAKAIFFYDLGIFLEGFLWSDMETVDA